MSSGSSTMSNLWNSAKQRAYNIIQQGQRAKPATKLLAILNNKYISPLVSNIPGEAALKTGLSVASAFGFKRRRMPKKNRKGKR